MRVTTFLMAFAASIMLSAVGTGIASAETGDDALNMAVIHKLEGEKALASSDISVQTAGGVTTLRGEVAEMRLSQIARRIADSVPGVEGVNDRLAIVTPTDREHAK